MWLAIFAAVAVFTVADSARRLRHVRTPAATGPESELPPRDARALAWLRGGDHNLILLVTYDLVCRGFLKVEIIKEKPTHKLMRTELAPDFGRLDPLETALLLAFEQPRAVWHLSYDPKVVRRAQEVSVELRRGLAAAGLAVPREDNVRRGLRIPAYLAAIAAAAGVACGLTDLPDPALAVAIVFAFLSGMTVTMLSLPIRATNSGRELLRGAESDVDATRLKLLYAPGEKVDYVALRAAYGWQPSLGEGEDPAVKLFRKATGE